MLAGALVKFPFGTGLCLISGETKKLKKYFLEKKYTKDKHTFFHDNLLSPNEHQDTNGNGKSANDSGHNWHDDMRVGVKRHVARAPIHPLLHLHPLQNFCIVCEKIWRKTIKEKKIQENKKRTQKYFFFAHSASLFFFSVSPAACLFFVTQIFLLKKSFNNVAKKYINGAN